MSDFKSRLLTEKTELDEKIEKLSSFVHGEAIKSIDTRQQELLAKQLPTMQQYSEILYERIGLLN